MYCSFVLGDHSASVHVHPEPGLQEEVSSEEASVSASNSLHSSASLLGQSSPNLGRDPLTSNLGPGLPSAGEN